MDVPTLLHIFLFVILAEYKLSQGMHVLGSCFCCDMTAIRRPVRLGLPLRMVYTEV